MARFTPCPGLSTAKGESTSEILSEVAYFRQQQALRDEAAQRGLSGFAITATQGSITARMQRGAERVLHLIEEGKYEEALAMLTTDDWCLEEQEITGEPVDIAARSYQVPRRTSMRNGEMVVVLTAIFAAVTLLGFRAAHWR